MKKLLDKVTAGTKDDDKAVSAALDAFTTFQLTTKEQRIELLNNIISEYENRYDDFVQIITKEMGSQYGYLKQPRLKQELKIYMKL